MCDESKRAEKPEAQAAATAVSQVAAQVKPQGATQVKPQGAAPATTAASQVAPHVKAQGAVRKDADSKKAQVVDPEFARAENEDDDGYDPYSDRRPVSEPLFERDPWS